MKLLLLNAGSSSLKTALHEVESGRTLASSVAEWAGTVTRYEFTGPDGVSRAEDVPWRGPAPALRRWLQDLIPAVIPAPSALGAVGHRVVHGGSFTTSVRLTPEVRGQIAALSELAPLHNPSSLETIAAAEAELPEVPHIAVFDTSFHATIPPAAATYPVPKTWTTDWALRRYGFHGLSHAYCARRVPELLNRPASELRIVNCHLGHGCSAAAIVNGKSVDTTMGFTPLEGLMMATRSGSIDPGMLLHLQQRHGLSASDLEQALNRQSGLLGVSGVSADLREVQSAAEQGNADAQLALGIYVHRIRQAIGAFAVTMGGIDALVFTAGVGEHAAGIRACVCEGLQCLGLELDTAANNACQPDAEISLPSSRARILVIAAREDLTMCEEVLRVLSRERSN